MNTMQAKPTKPKLTQAQLDFRLRYFIAKGDSSGRDRLEEFLSDGANPCARVPGYGFTAAEQLYSNYRSFQFMFAKEAPAGPDHWQHARMWLYSMACVRRDLLLILAYRHPIAESYCQRWYWTQYGHPYHFTGSNGQETDHNARYENE